MRDGHVQDEHVARFLRPVVPLTLAVAALALPAGASAALIHFQTPSHRIGCIYDGSGRGYLRCDVRGISRTPPPSCDLDSGGAFSMARRSRSHILCAGDTALCAPHERGCRTVAYGTTWNHGGFKCKSRRTGLTCTNEVGHGFFLSRESQRVF